MSFLFPFLFFSLLLSISHTSEDVLIDYYDLELMELEDLAKEYQISLEEDEECLFDAKDHMITWNTLMIHNNLINRTKTDLVNGMTSLTESDDPRVAFKIKKHIHQMFARMQCREAVRAWDPLFKVLFENAPFIEEEIEDTKKGVIYKRTSKNKYVQRVIDAHAKVITEFVSLGREQTRMSHIAPMED